MLRRRRAGRRSGATVVELAAVAPVFVLILFATIIGGLGVFRYNQVSSLAREGARYAAVRGLDYAREAHQPAATQNSIHATAVAPLAVGMDPSRLSTVATWDQSNAPRRANPDGTATTNYVTVTVSYRWAPEALFGGEIVLSSTSRMPMSY